MVEKYRTEISDTLKRVRDGHKLNNTNAEKESSYLDFTQLSDEQYEKLNKLNLELASYEVEIKRQIFELLTMANQKIENKYDYVNHQEGCEIELFFYLDSNDEYYDDEDDNILMVLSQDFMNLDNVYGLYDGENHNYLPKNKWKEIPFFKNDHCWLFHALCDYTQLHWEEILRIESIDINIIQRLNIHRHSL